MREFYLIIKKKVQLVRGGHYKQKCDELTL